MKLINLTPHSVTIFDLDAEKIELPSSGVARVSTEETDLGIIGQRPFAHSIGEGGSIHEKGGMIGGIPIVSSPILGPVVGLPKPEEGVAYIVSLMVLQHPDVHGRADVFAPATGPKHAALRDEQGRITGVTRLVAAPRG